jgi:hypothetical protein
MVKAAIGRGLALALLLLPLAGCGKGGGQSDAFVESVVSTFTAECQRMAPSSPQAAKRQQLCTCTAEKIRTSGIKASDSDKSNDDRIHAAQQACRQQVYGNKD